MASIDAPSRLRFSLCVLFCVCVCLSIQPAAEELEFIESVGGSTLVVTDDFGTWFTGRPKGLYCYNEGSRLIFSNHDEAVWAHPLGTVELGGPLTDAAFSLDGNYLFVTVGSAGFKVIDFNDVSNPVIVASFPVNGEAVCLQYTLIGTLWVSVHKYPDNAVELPTSTILSFDILDPTAPVIFDEYPSSEDPLILYRSRRISLDDDNLFVTDEVAGLNILSIDQNGKFSFAGSYLPSTGKPSALAPLGDSLLATGGERGIDILNVQNPAQPQFVSKLELDLGVKDINPFDFNGRRTLFVTGESAGIVAVDVTNPASPLAFAGAGPPGFDLALGDGRAIVAQGSEGVARYDITQLPSLDAQLFIPHSLVSEFFAHLGYFYAFTSPVPTVLEPQGLSLVELGPAGFYAAQTVVDVATAGGYAYLYTNFDSSIHNFDLSDPEHPQEVGAIEVGQLVSIAAAGGMICGVGTVNGTPAFQVVDVTTPSAPTGPTTLNVPDPLSHVTLDPLDPGRCYAIGLFGELQTIDVSDPSAPKVLGTLTLGGATGFKAAVSGDYLYVTTTASEWNHDSYYDLLAIDVSDPEHPTPVQEVPVSGLWRSMQIVGNFLFGIQKDYVVRYDITDPAHPKFIDEYYAPNKPNRFVVEGNAVYTAGERGYYSIDLETYSPLPEPEIRKSNLPRADAPVITAYGSVMLGRGVTEYRPSEDVLAALLDKPVEYSALVATSPTQVWAAGLNGLDEYQRSPGNPPELVRRAFSGFFDTLAIKGNRAYVGGQDGLQILDLTQQPANVLGADSTSAIHGITVSGDYAYTVARDFTSGVRGKFQVSDISNDNQPVRLGSLATSSLYEFTTLPYYDGINYKAGGKELHGVVYCAYTRLAFPGDPDPVWGHAGLVAIDVTDPHSVEELDVLPAGKENMGMAVEGDRAYLAAGADGVIVVDISDPTDLRVVESYPTGWPATGVAAEDGLVAVTLGPGGLLLLQGPVPVRTGPDIDGNGQVNAVDVQLVVNAVLGLPIDFDADVNQDQNINAVDVQFVVNGVLGLL